MKKSLITIIMFCFCILNVNDMIFANSSNLGEDTNCNTILLSDYYDDSLVGTNEHNFTTSYIYIPNGSEVFVKQYTEDLSHVYDNHYCIYCEEYTFNHDYDRNYLWINYINHSVECSCGNVITAGHAKWHQYLSTLWWKS